MVLALAMRERHSKAAADEKSAQMQWAAARAVAMRERARGADGGAGASARGQRTVRGDPNTSAEQRVKQVHAIRRRADFEMNRRTIELQPETEKRAACLLCGGQLSEPCSTVGRQCETYAVADLRSRSAGEQRCPLRGTLVALVRAGQGTGDGRRPPSLTRRRMVIAPAFPLVTPALLLVARVLPHVTAASPLVIHVLHLLTHTSPLVAHVHLAGPMIGLDGARRAALDSASLGSIGQGVEMLDRPVDGGRDRGEFGGTALGVGDSRDEMLPHFVAHVCARAAFPDFEQLGDLLQRETQPLGRADEAEPLNRFLAVDPVTRGSPAGREKARAFVEAQGGRGDADALG